jgi:hypothetical protein
MTMTSNGRADRELSNAVSITLAAPAIVTIEPCPKPLSLPAVANVIGVDESTAFANESATNIIMAAQILAPRHLTRHLRPNASKVLVVYSKATGERRRVVDADDDGEYAWHEANTRSGEGFAYVDHATYDAFPHAHALNDHVAQIAGFTAAPDPSTTRHAVVDPQGNVVNIVHADPSCGDDGEEYFAGHTLIQHPTVGIGDKVVNGILVVAPVPARKSQRAAVVE